jgi:hypothetical protein
MPESCIGGYCNRLLAKEVPWADLNGNSLPFIKLFALSVPFKPPAGFSMDYY